MGLYLVESLKSANKMTQSAFTLILLSTLSAWIAYCTDSWGRSYPPETGITTGSSYVGYGIWAVSSNSVDLGQLVSKTDGWLLGWYGAFQAFATFGFLSVNVGFLLIILYVFVTPCKSNTDLVFYNGILNFVGGFCWFLAVIIFGSAFGSMFETASLGTAYQLHFSYVLGVMTFNGQVAVGIDLLVLYRKGSAVAQSEE